MKTAPERYETIKRVNQYDKANPKKYEWLHRIAEVNELARAQGMTYGHFVSKGFMYFSMIKAPAGYKTDREWREIRSAKES